MSSYGSQFNIEKIGKRQRWDDDEYPRNNKRNQKHKRTKGFDKRKDVLDSQMKEDTNVRR